MPVREAAPQHAHASHCGAQWQGVQHKLPFAARQPARGSGVWGGPKQAHLTREARREAAVLVDLRELRQLVRARSRALLLLAALLRDVRLLRVPVAVTSPLVTGKPLELCRVRGRHGAPTLSSFPRHFSTHARPGL